MGFLIFTICLTVGLISLIVASILTDDADLFGGILLIGVVTVISWLGCVFSDDDKTITLVKEHAPIEIRTTPTKIMVFSGDLETTYTEIKYSKLSPTNFLVVQTYSVFGKKTGKEIRADIDLK